MQSLADHQESERKMQKQHTKEVASAKRSAVVAVANIISVASLLENEQSIPEEIEDGVKHYAELINKLQGRESGQIHWRQERDSLVKNLNQYVSGSTDSVPHTDISFIDLAQIVSEQISSGTYPEIL
jgi:hypothetical protein